MRGSRPPDLRPDPRGRAHAHPVRPALVLHVALREAEPLTRRALEIARTVHGPGHPKTARRLQVLAGLLREAGRTDEAEPLAREAVGIFEGVLGADHPMTRSARKDLARLTAA